MAYEKEPRWFDFIEMLLDKVIEFCEQFDEGYFFATVCFIFLVALITLPFHCSNMPPKTEVESKVDAYESCVSKPNTDREVCKDIVYGKKQ